MTNHYQRTDVYTQLAPSEPKHLFRWLVDYADSFGTLPGKVLDVGAAAGAFQRYVLSRFPQSAVTGVEYDYKLVTVGNKTPNTGVLLQGDANDLSFLEEKNFDFIFVTGVHSIFDEIEPLIDGCLSVCAPGGVIMITGLFNTSPLDARILWRYPDKPDDNWHPGYNLYSQATVSTLLRNKRLVESFEFTPFRLPFDLPPQDDPVRSWTYEDGSGEAGFALRNGIMPLNIQRLTIRPSGAL